MDQTNKEKKMITPDDYEVTLVLHRQELAATVEALYEALLHRVRWTVQRKERQTPGGWGNLDFETAQTLIDQTAGALTRALMTVSEQENVHEDFQKMFTPSEAVWDLVNGITLASGWHDAPVHGRHELCPVCEALVT